MLTIKTFIFNPIAENTYLLYDESHEAVIIDPGNYEKYEDEALAELIKNENLSVKFILNTHPHVDHVVGNSFCKKSFVAPLLMHKNGLGVYRYAPHYCVAFGLDAPEFPSADRFFDDGDEITFGNQVLKVIYTPGHTSGCVSFYDAADNSVFVGDALFKGSIGRTDLPTGDYELLLESIRNKLFILPEETAVYSGHGETTTIFDEKRENPFFNKTIN